MPPEQAQRSLPTSPAQYLAESCAFHAPLARYCTREWRSELIDRLRGGIDAFNRTGEVATGFFAREFELQQASSIVDTAGVFRGPDAFRDSLDELGESFEDLSFEPEGFLEAPGGEVVVFLHVRARGRGSGMEIDNHIAWVWTFRGEQAVRLVVYEEAGDALEAVGVQE